LLFALTGLLSAPHAFAEEPGPEVPVPESSPPPPMRDDSPATVRVRVGEGLTVTSGNGRHSIGLRTRFVPRFDVAWPTAGEPAETRASIATARIWIHGHVFDPRFRYVFQLAVAGRDFRDGATSPIFDAFV